MRARRWLAWPVALLAAAAAAIAAASPVSAATPQGTDKVKYYLVKSHVDGAPESLTEIALRLLGSPDRSADIYQLNVDRIQTDGQRLTDPNVLVVGWALILPWDAFGPGVILGPLPTASAAGPSSAGDGGAAGPSTGPNSGSCVVATQRAALGIPWAQLRLAPDQAWPISRGGGVTVAVVGSGVDATVPALAGRVSAGADLVSGKARGDSDCLGHGTAMAGIVAAQPRVGSGLVGIAPEATVMPVKVLLANGAPTTTDIASAITVAVSAGATVIMVPWPVDGSDHAVDEALDRALGRDVVLVVAADTTGTPTLPRAGVLRVGGIRANDELVLPYPSGAVDVLAPGAEVVSLSPKGGTDIEGTGTDFAVPFVAGLAALVRSASPGLSAPDVVRIIESTADRGTASAPDGGYGWGVISPRAAVVASVIGPSVEATSVPTKRVGTAETLAIVMGSALIVVFVAMKLRRRKDPRDRAARSET